MKRRVILGPPGTGKTTTLLNIVEDALERGVSPDRIGYVSFTTRAAKEAVDRARQKFNLEKDSLPFFSTIHSLCFRQLGIKRGEVLEGRRMKEFAEYAKIRITGRYSEDGTLAGFETGDRIMFMENLARIRGVPLRQVYEEDDDNLSWDEVENVSIALKKFKAAHGLVDFTDMLTEFVRSGIRVRLDELVVDETQDLSQAQWRVIETLEKHCKNVAYAGDDDQGIYRWAGADVDHLIGLSGDAEVLGQSYRVPPVVQRVANDVIRRVRNRHDKTWSARTGERGKVDRAARFSAVNCDSGTTLVLARNSYILKDQVEPELRYRGIVYERHGHSSIPQGMIEAVRGWERLRRGDKVDVATVRRIYDNMSSGVGYRRGNKTLPGREDDERLSMKQLRADAGLLADGPWFEALDRLPKNDVGYIRRAVERREPLTGRPRVVVSTIHGSKGGEADHVVLMKEMAARTHREMNAQPEDEMRVWYVGATRARRKLTIVGSQTPRECPWL